MASGNERILAEDTARVAECLAVSNPISNVSDTARWVAIYRAMESERPDAIFHDPYARKLGGAQGEAIVRHMPRGARSAWPMIVRTAVMDEIILREVAAGTTAVLNIAAGLDTRAYRLDLPSSLAWFHADLPGMVAYVKDAMAGERPRCRLEYTPADMTNAAERSALFARVAQAAGSGSVLVIAEGLLIYLEREEVTDLAKALAAPRNFRKWLIDLASPALLRWLAKGWGKKLQQGNAPMKFAPPEGTKFFESAGWHEVEFRSTWEESFRLQRTMRLAWLWNLIGKLQPAAKREEGRRFSGIVLLDRVTA